jgi:AcrR family transcriptional regulator
MLMKDADPLETRLQALECLQAIARESGLDAVSMRAVARRVGISLAALQYHYPTKEALLGAFVRRLVSEHQERLAQVLALAPVGDRFPAAVRYTLEVAVEQSEGGVLSMIEARAHHDPVAAAVLSDFNRRYVGALGEVIAPLHPALGQREVALASVLVASLIDGACGYLPGLDSFGLERRDVIEGVIESAYAAVSALAGKTGPRRSIHAS